MRSNCKKELIRKEIRKIYEKIFYHKNMLEHHEYDNTFRKDFINQYEKKLKELWGEYDNEKKEQ